MMLDASYTLTPIDSTVCVNITIEDDDMLENEEYFSATLVGNLPPAATFNITSTIIQIEDNERMLKNRCVHVLKYSFLQPQSLKYIQCCT